MAISIITHGPDNGTPISLIPKAKNLMDMVTLISDEIDDTTNEYSSQIQAAIFAAIRVCEREPFYFNDSSDVVISTQKDKTWYSGKDEKLLNSIIRIVAAYYQFGTGKEIELQRLSIKQFTELENSAYGRPESFCYFAQKIGFYPTPNEDKYKIKLILSPIRLSALTSIDEMAPWFTEAFDLIKARAKYELYKDIIKDPPLALAALNDFNEQMAMLHVETSRRQATGNILATRF